MTDIKQKNESVENKENLCADCQYALNALNGRYCTKLQRYVEYAATPQCLTNKKQRI